MSEVYTCDKCEGLGYIKSIDTLNTLNTLNKYSCVQCGGSGVLDWAARVTGRPLGTLNHTTDISSIHSDGISEPWKDVIDSHVKTLSDEIDLKVLEAITKLAEKNNLKL